MGLAQTAGNSKLPTLLDFLYSDNYSVDKNVFALCYGMRGGYMTIWGFEPNLHKEQTV